MDARAAERRGWPRRDLSGHGQCAGSDGDTRLPARTIRAASPPSARCRSCWSSAHERLLPALRIAGVGYGLGSLAMQEVGCATSLAASTRALDWLQTEQLLDEPGDWQANGRISGAAAGPFSSRTTITPIWMTRRWSPGPCIRRRTPPITPRASPGARLAGGYAEQEWRICRVRCGQHLVLSEQDSVRRSRRAAGSAYQRCDGAGRDRLARIGRPQDQRALERAIAICAPSRNRTAPGSAAGARTTSTGPGRCSPLWRRPAWGRRIRPCGARSTGSDAEPGRRLGREQRQLRQECARRRQGPSTPYQTAWALLGCSHRARRIPMRCGAGSNHLMRTQQADGLWSDPSFTAPGFPRVFYFKYHGYCAYFPLWALAAYRTLTRAGTAH